MTTICRVFPALFGLLVPLLLTLPVSAASPAVSPASPAAAGDYELSLSFLLGEGSGTMTGTAKITIQPGTPLTLAFPRLTVTGTLLRGEDGRESHLLPDGDILILPPSPESRTLYISYSKKEILEEGNVIGPAGISLIANWYPLPDRPMRYRVSAALPENFTAITESDTFPLVRSPLTPQSNRFEASFSRPVEAIHFVAGPYTIHKRPVRENLFVYTMLFPEDRELADEYLQAAAGYLNRYEHEIGPFPYNHYVIVANRRPTGLGMPTFTLLGQAVLRLPFITATSLGHEIVHSWFGNAVEVDYARGNWAEGLTSFLADRTFRQESGEGAADRKESITRYHSYVHGESIIPLKDFASASHDQAMAEARRAVGYDRGALLFHELRERIGETAFREGLRRFYADNNGRQAGWEELEAGFATAAGADLSRFFQERLQRTDIPAIAVKDIEVKIENHRPLLAFTLLQETNVPYALVVPIRIRTTAGDIAMEIATDAAEKQIAIPLEHRPLSFTLDPEYDFLRRLDPAEYPPVWSRFMGSDQRLAILGVEEDRELFQPLLDLLGEGRISVKRSEEVTDKELAEHDLLFLGIDQPRARALFGPPPAVAGFALDVRRNPLNTGRVAVLAASGGREETAQAARRLSHYGKYSSLAFSAGRNTEKKIQPAEAGLQFVLETLPQGGATSELDDFARMVDRIAEARVIYIGETHTSTADHLLQLRLIESLALRKKQLAIGMEMFPAAVQPVLDRYTRSQDPLDERTFLKESGYYDVWRFDWRYYRDIVNYAKTHGLPVIGLNLDRQIVSEVFRSGGTDSLTPEMRRSLPPDRDLDMAGYLERLAPIHALHVEGAHGQGGTAGFVQAQAIWDETMAENIARFLEANPGYSMVVLAGAQHTRKDSGIPPRVARRLPVKQATVVNAAGERSPLDLEKVTDYYFFASAADLPEAPKIGVILTTETGDGRSFLRISQLSPHGKAAAAGLIEGDILAEVGGAAVSDMADLHIAMQDRKPGETIGVTVRRMEDGQEQTLTFQVELTVPPPSLSHP